MEWGDYCDFGSESAVVAYGYECVVLDGEVVVGEEAFADFGVDAVVEVDGSLHE